MDGSSRHGDSVGPDLPRTRREPSFGWIPGTCRKRVENDTILDGSLNSHSQWGQSNRQRPRETKLSQDQKKVQRHGRDVLWLHFFVPGVTQGDQDGNGGILNDNLQCCMKHAIAKRYIRSHVMRHQSDRTIRWCHSCVDPRKRLVGSVIKHPKEQCQPKDSHKQSYQGMEQVFSLVLLLVILLAFLLPGNLDGEKS